MPDTSPPAPKSNLASDGPQTAPAATGLPNQKESISGEANMTAMFKAAKERAAKTDSEQLRELFPLDPAQCATSSDVAMKVLEEYEAPCEEDSDDARDPTDKVSSSGKPTSTNPKE